ncbi:MAG TPA: glycosyltransferase family 1 protein [Acidimicrobiia bacterium]|nr:glycosyltransferase family 1 protein [Acidimicrobiia bacterium]
MTATAPIGEDSTTGKPAAEPADGAALRVAVDATSLLGVRTGVSRVTSGLLAGIADRPEVAVTAYAVTWRGRQGLAEELPPAVRAAPRAFPARLTRWSWPRVRWPSVEGWTGPVDVVHATNYVAPPAHAPVLVSVHDLSFVRFPELCTGDAARYPRLVQVAIDRGAFVHTDSAFVAEEVRDHYGLTADRVVHVAPGLDAAALGDGGRGRTLAGSARYVLAIGTVEPRKNLPALVRAFDAVAAYEPDVSLVVAGPDGWGMAEFTDAVEGAVHRDRIRRLGWLEDAARRDLLAGAAVLAYPSRYEGFGFPPLEAMQAGVPVVASTAGSLPEVLADAAVLVDAADEDALAGALARVLREEALAEDLVRRGRARAAEFRWDRAAEQFVKTYQRVAAG